MNHWVTHILYPVAVSVMVSACSGSPTPDPVTTAMAVPETKTMDEMAQILTETALRAQASFARFSLSQTEANPSKGAPAPRLVPKALLQSVTIEWLGPLDTLVRKFASIAGYSYIKIGKQPAQPIMIEINVKGKPLIVLLRDTGLQTGTQATLKIDPDRKVFEVAYRG